MSEIVFLLIKTILCLFHTCVWKLVPLFLRNTHAITNWESSNFAEHRAPPSLPWTISIQENGITFTLLNELCSVKFFFFFFPTSDICKSGTCISVDSYFIFHPTIKHFTVSTLHVPGLFISFPGELMWSSFFSTQTQIFYVLDLRP